MRIAIYAHDAAWQYPAITEKHAYAQIIRQKAGSASNIAYFGFPFATLFDLITHTPANNPRRAELLAALDASAKELSRYDRVVTVCQHIRAREFHEIFLRTKITDLFWSHTRIGETRLAGLSGLRLHPFPLFPVQQRHHGAEDINRRRRLLFSFVGARARPIYLTNVRDMIGDLLAGHPAGRVVLRDTWLYNSIVYDQQIRERPLRMEQDQYDRESIEFLDILDESTFTLCPSGTGPNSIRIWESLLNGSIPVIISDSWTPPGPIDLWQQAAVWCAETAPAILALPDRLAAIAADTGRLRQMRKFLLRLADRYGPQDFVADIRDLAL